MNPSVLATMDKANHRINWSVPESTVSAWHHPPRYTSNGSYLGVNMAGDNDDDANQQRFYYQTGAGWGCNEIQNAAEECKPSLLYADNQALRHFGFLQSSPLNPPLYYTGPTTPTPASIFRNNEVSHDGIVVDTSLFPISTTSTTNNNVAGNIALSQFQSSPTDVCMQFGELVGSAMQQQQQQQQQQQRYIDMSSRLGLNLGSQTYFSGSDHTAAAALLQHFSRRPARFSSSSAAQIPSCQAQGCKADLSLAKHYHRRHKVCEFHSKLATVVISGSTQRFCQQCSRFHGLSEFDEGKRSCRKRLADHNRRRRKPQPASNIVADMSKINSATTSPTAPTSSGNNDNGSQALGLTKIPPNRIQIKSEAEDGDHDGLLKYEAESQSSPCPSLSLSTVGATDSANKSTNNKSLQSEGSYYRGLELPKFPWLQPKQQEVARIKEKSSSSLSNNNNVSLSSSSPSHNMSLSSSLSHNNMSLSPSQQDNERLLPNHLNSNSNHLNSNSLQNFFPHINRNSNHHQSHAENSFQRADRQEVLSLLINHEDGENRGDGVVNPYQHTTTSQLADSHFFQINQFLHSRNSTQEAAHYNNGD